MSEQVKFENSNIVVEMEKQPHCAIKMNIFVNPLASQAAYSKAFKKVRQAVSLPGFRKGKAPESVVKASFAPQIEREWKDVLQRVAVTEACTLAGFFPYEGAPPVKIESETVSLNQQSHLVASFEAAPTVPKVNLKEIAVSLPQPKEITEDMVDERVNEFRMLYAEWSTVEGRGLQEWDYVDLDIADAKKPEILFCKDQTFSFLKEKMPSWLYDPLMGRVVGDVVEATSEKSKEDDDKNFQPTLCSVTVKAIRTARLPEVDESFVKKFGASSQEEFRAYVKSGLVGLAQVEAREKFAQAVEDFLVNKYPFDLPKSYIEKNSREMIQQEFERLQEGGESPDVTESKLRRYAASLNVEHDLKRMLLLQAIARDEKISVDQKEVLQAVSPQELEGVKDYRSLFAKAYNTVWYTKVMAAIENGISQ